MEERSTDLSYRRAIYPASLDPIHYGHMDVAMRAAKLFDELIVAVYDMSKKTMLFLVQERVALASEALQACETIKVTSYSGLTVEYARQVGAGVIVRGLRVFSDFEAEFRMETANKQLAPDIETVVVMSDLKHTHVSSSTVREVAQLGGDVSSMVPLHVEKALYECFRS